MRRKFNLLPKRVAQLLAALFLFFSVATQGEPLEDLVTRLDGLKGFYASFNQITVNSAQQLVDQSAGEVWVMKPRSFRLHTKEPFEQILVSDGETLWNYETSLEQVVISELPEDMIQVPLLLFSNRSQDIASEFDVTGLGNDTFILEPRSDNAMFETLSVAFGDQSPASLTIKDSLGQITRIDFKQPSGTMEMASDMSEDGLFAFVIPEGVDVIDDRI